MKLIVSDEIRDRFPDLRIGIVTARQIDNHGTDAELQDLKRAAANRWYEELTNSWLDERPEITAWRNAYRAFGVKPKDSRPTAEAFLRRLIKGDEFPTISKAVDAYLLTETEYYLPVGGYDLSSVKGNIILRLSEGGEAFTPIGASAEELTRPGEVVYADDGGVLTRKWNYRDCDRAKVTNQSTDIALFTEGPYAIVATETLQDSVSQIAQRIGKYCGGQLACSLLNVGLEPEITLN